MATKIFTLGGGWVIHMPMQRRRLLAALGAGSAVGTAGCLDSLGSLTDRSEASAEGRWDELTLATTTSTYDSGLIDALLPTFQRSVGVRVRPVVKGTGAALRTAADGNADLALVHAREAEDEFLQAGHGINRRDVMENDFVVVGPQDDPAAIHGTRSATEAFEAIASAESLFVSRGDDSGTHRKEREIWRASKIEPSGRWYQETGQGQGDTLRQATLRGAYALADRGTYRSMMDELDLVVHVQGSLEGGPALLRNPYGAIATNPANHDDIKYSLAMAFVGFLTGPRGQTLIADYTANGRQLFVPTALSAEPNFEQYVPAGWGRAGGRRGEGGEDGGGSES